MKQIQEPGRRIVSKGEYAEGIVYKALVFAAAVGLCLLGPLCVAGICVLLFEAKNAPLADRPFLLILFVIMALGSGFACQLGRRTVQEAKAIDPGIPLTRASTEYLPAPDSLVRASEEPAQAPQDVLLRAVTREAEQHKEQLLRAGAERQK